ncbi:hypothetical protein HPP92_014736 [Vanilla planifolia]|uniref:ACB domain-containing protein n=1 Tax=Vanilla planifolia TaxID=51239 RepID=A0A835QHW6_VANPL|nr:hypothetical protein HPP92_014736 [Vanilla planifolia]
MGDWQEFGQAVLLGLIFSYLVAKLISTVISFRGENLKVVRDKDLLEEFRDRERGSEEVIESTEEKEPVEVQSSSEDDRERVSVGNDVVGVSGQEGSIVGDLDDDWEGIESTELDEIFSAASAFVAAAAVNQTLTKISTDVQLQLYGFYKIATEGPCSAPQPSAFKVAARAKWNAWQKLGAMPPEEAMQKYIEIVNEIFPSWAAGSIMKNKHEEAPSSSSSAKGTMGPVFSSLILEEGSNNDLRLDGIHISAREGEVYDLLKHIGNGVPVNLRDSEGRTALHWAVDRGHLEIVEMLLSRNADVNAKDNEDQTPLHYAAVCERESFAELLIKHGADTLVKDMDGNSPVDLCSSPWNFLTRAE